MSACYDNAAEGAALSARTDPRRSDAPGVIAKPAGLIAGQSGLIAVDEARHPSTAAVFSTWSIRAGLLCLDLLQAMIDRSPVIGDWFCHFIPPDVLRLLLLSPSGCFIMT
jgi:hypothetical protein